MAGAWSRTSPSSLASSSPPDSPPPSSPAFPHPSALTPTHFQGEEEVGNPWEGSLAPPPGFIQAILAQKRMVAVPLSLATFQMAFATQVLPMIRRTAPSRGRKITHEELSRIRCYFSPVACS